MTRGRDGDALRDLRALLGGGAVGHLSDGQLIERFLARSGAGAESAFAALVERHGPAVLRVCRSVLADAEAAQDAFQATFLVLVRKAGSVRVRDSLGPWLVAVAYRTASSARSAEARRRAVERGAAVSEARPPAESRDDLAAVRAEVDRLADRYRRPILLCYFAGLTHEGAARQLGCPVGTVRSRLAWGRKQLRERLVRRGLAPSALAVLATAPTRAGVPTTLLIQIARAASRLAAGEAATATGAVSAAAVAEADGIVRAMFMTKLKGIAAAVLALGLAAAGGVVLAEQDTPGSDDSAKKSSLGLPSRPKDETDPRARPAPSRAVSPTPATPAVRPDVELEMLLRAAREQEQGGNQDQALALTGRMEEALRAWRTELQRRRDATIAGAREQGIDRSDPLALARYRRMLTQQDVERAAVPFPDTKVIEFPSGEKWRSLLEHQVRREPSAKFSAPAIRARLEEKVSLHLGRPFPLGEALQVIRAASAGKDDTGIPIYVGPGDLKRAKVTLDAPVTLDVEGAPISQALQGLLDPLGLSYHVKDGWILIDAARPASPMRR